MLNNSNRYTNSEEIRKELKSTIRWIGAACLINYIILFLAYLISFIIGVLIILSNVDKNISLYLTIAFLFCFVSVHFIGTIFLTIFRKNLRTLEKKGGDDFLNNVYCLENRLFKRILTLSIFTSILLSLAIIYDNFIISK